MQFNVDGATLEVSVEGDEAAPAVLLWNGASCTLRMWDVVVDALRSEFWLIRFDVRGTGQSSPTDDPERQYRLERYADDAIDILDGQDVEEVIVWAMAWGARAALAFAALHPDRVSRAALFDASIGPADVKAQAAGHKRAMALQAALGIAPFERPVGWNVHRHPECVQPALGAAAKFDLRGAVARLTMPLLVATGDQDPNLTSSRELVDLAPDARLVVMENVGHGSVLQRPDLTAEVFREFASANA